MIETKRPNHRPPKERKIDPHALTDDFYTIYEVADLLKLSYRTIQRMIKAGELSAKKYGGRWRIKADDLKQFLDDPGRETAPM